MSDIYDLAAIGPSQFREVGSKTFRLAQLFQAGLPVPAGFCVSVSAYRRWAGSAGRPSAEGPAAPPPLDLSGRSLPDDLSAAILRACERASAGDTSARWAVRSSAVGEDSQQASFAGQLETFLDVPSADVPERVRACWLSLWSARVTYYRSRWWGAEAMAVLVQRQVVATAAGVAFSRDPVTGDEMVVVEAIAGAGANVAQGTVTPTRYGVPGAGDGDHGAAEGGPLTSEQVSALAAIVRQVEDLLGWPVDLEWAFADGRLAVLQARPLTAGGVESFFTTRLGDDDLWTAGFVNERFPGPVSPLGWTLIQEPFERLALREPLSYIGYPEAWRRPMIKLYHGHPYVLVEAFASLYKLLPDWLLPEDAVRYFPHGRTELRKQAAYPRSWRELRLWRAALRTLWRERGNLSPFHNDRLWQRYRGSYADALNRIAEAVRGADSAAALLGQAQNVQRANEGLLAIHRWSLTHADLWYTLLRRLARRCLGADWAAQVAALVRGSEEASVALNQQLQDLADLAARDPRLREALTHAQTMADLASELPDSPPGRELLAGLADFLGRYGHRSYNLDIYHPGFAADPSQVFLLIRGLAAARSAAPESVREMPPPSSDGWRSFVIRPVLSLARRYLGLREEQRLCWQQGLALLRRIYLAVGACLVDRRYLDHAEDIFFLTAAEVSAAVAGRGRAAETRWLCERRLHEFATLAAEQTHHPEFAYPSFLRGEVPLITTRRGSADVLKGTPVSAGVAAGLVRVVREPGGLAQVQAGEVLVAPSVDPGWTPIFGKIAALVTESGGQLSHPAVVAREYGLPAVLAVPGATQHLQTGERVLVDGSLGTVLRLKDSQT
ncbi:MAG: PEP/pyruvate-binding domain-containing protein [Chloroflexota bacterium]